MTLNCNNPNFVGKNVIVEYALACGDVDPRALSYAPVGSMRGKDLTLSADTVDTTADDSSGGFRSNLVTFKTLEFSGDGVARVNTASDTGQTVLLDHFIAEEQPVAWFRFTYPDRTIYAYSIITELSRSAPFDEVVTFSLTTMVTDTGSLLYPAVIVDKTPAPATGITLSPANISLAPGATQQITATITPNDGVQRKVTYTSSNPGIVTVSVTGLATGVAQGNATITGKVGTKVGVASVTVTAGTIVAPTSVTVSPKPVSGTVGGTQQMTATVAPSNASDKSVTWSSSNTAVATVSNTGLVSFVAAGSATITATTNTGALTDSAAITVAAATVNPTSVALSPKPVSGVVGGTQQLTATVLPANATNKSVTYASSNTSIATVSASGLVSFVAAGSATITVTTVANGLTDTDTVTVTAATVAPTGVVLSPKPLSLTVGQTQQLTATVSPSNATDKSVSYASSNTSIATVSASGLVTAVAAGSATITVTTNTGGLTDTDATTVTAVPAADMTIRRGMNVSGAEYSENVLPGSDPTNYRLPTQTNFSDWKAQGANVIRVPLLLGRLVDAPGGNLTTAGTAALDSLEASYNATGVPAIIDFHDYAKRYINGAQQQLGSAAYPLSAWYSDLAKVAAYIKGKSAFYAIDPINEPNGFSPLQSEFNYVARPFKQLMRDPQFRNTSPDLNWYLAGPFSISPTGGSNGGGRMSWNASGAYIDAVRHRNGAGLDGPDVLVAGQQYTLSFSYQSTATGGTNTLYLATGNYANSGGTALANIPLPAAASKTRVSVTFTMPAGQTGMYMNFNMQGFSGVGFAEDFNITEGATLQSFVPWSSDGTVAPLSVAMNGAIDAIRKAGFTGWIMYEGDRASGLMDFANNYGFSPDVVPWVDPLNRTMLSLHHYTDYSGAYTTAWTQAERDRVLPSIKVVNDWSSAKGVQIQIGEWAPPNDASSDSANRRTDMSTAADQYNTNGWHHTYWAAGVVPGSFTSITAVAPDSSKGNITNLPIFQSHSANPPAPPSNAVTSNGSSMTANGNAVTYN